MQKSLEMKKETYQLIGFTNSVGEIPHLTLKAMTGKFYIYPKNEHTYKVISGIKILIEATIQAKLHIEDMSARELIAALHNAESMEDVIAKLNGSPEPEKEPQNEDLSPMMKQFQELKAKHPGATFLFRCGDFYESYQEDAEVVAKTLGITLTKKDDIKMTGFPYHALDQYLPKLIRHGIRVAICDQIEAPKTAQKLAKRGSTEIVSSDNNAE